MRLRTAITRPSRYEEPSSQHCSALHVTCNKSTLPAYPDLLRAVTTRVTNTYPAAVFPSKTIGRLPNNPQPNTERSSSILNNPKLPQPQIPSKRALGNVPRDVSRTFAHAKDILGAQHDDCSGQSAVDQTILNEMQTSPLLGPMNGSNASGRAWKMINPTLQLYILDNLISQFHYADIVKEILGLNKQELSDLLRIKKKRTLQPETTESLWSYCRGLGNGTEGYVDPAIMRQYIEYFTFAAGFEDASEAQCLLAMSFLKERGIEGAFVDALLPEKAGIWTRTDWQPAEDFDETWAASSTPHETDEVEWNLDIPRTPIHSSHDLNNFATHFKNGCLKPSFRRSLLSTPRKNLSIFEDWLMYGSLCRKVVSTRAGLPNPSTLSKLPTEQEFCCHAQGRHVPDEKKCVELMLYASGKMTHQISLLSERVKQMPLSIKDRNRIIRMAKVQVEGKIMEELRFPEIEQLDDDSTGNYAQVSIDVDRQISPVEASQLDFIVETTVLSSDIVHSSSSVTDQVSSSATTPEPSARRPGFTNDGHGFSSSIVEIGKTPKTEVSPSPSLCPTTIEQPQIDSANVPVHFHKTERRMAGRYWSNSISATRSAKASNTIADFSFVKTIAKSPSAPPWSPITEGGEETHETERSLTSPPSEENAASIPLNNANVKMQCDSESEAGPSEIRSDGTLSAFRPPQLLISGTLTGNSQVKLVDSIHEISSQGAVANSKPANTNDPGHSMSGNPTETGLIAHESQHHQQPKSPNNTLRILQSCNILPGIVEAANEPKHSVSSSCGPTPSLSKQKPRESLPAPALMPNRSLTSTTSSPAKKQQTLNFSKPKDTPPTQSPKGKTKATVPPEPTSVSALVLVKATRSGSISPRKVRSDKGKKRKAYRTAKIRSAEGEKTGTGGE